MRGMLRDNNLQSNSFVICNNGYTVERYIHGWKAEYNDIQQWRFTDLIPAFGGKQDQFKSYQVRSKQELLKLFADEDFSSAKRLQVSHVVLSHFFLWTMWRSNADLFFVQLVELYMPQEDAPTGLRMTAAASAKRNMEG